MRLSLGKRFMGVCEPRRTIFLDIDQPGRRTAGGTIDVEACHLRLVWLRPPRRTEQWPRPRDPLVVRLDPLTVLFQPAAALFLADRSFDPGLGRAGGVEAQGLGFGRHVFADGEVGALASLGLRMWVAGHGRLRCAYENTHTRAGPWSGFVAGVVWRRTSIVMVGFFSV